MQEAIVAIIVIAAGWAVLARYAPPVVRRAMRTNLVRALRACGWEKAAHRFEAKAEEGACGSGCGTCGSCGTEEPAQNEFAISVDALKRSARR